MSSDPFQGDTAFLPRTTRHWIRDRGQGVVAVPRKQIDFEGESREPALHQVAPRAISRSELNVEVRALGKPVSNRRGLVRAVVVENNVNLRSGRHLGRSHPETDETRANGGRDAVDRPHDWFSTPAPQTARAYKPHATTTVSAALYILTGR